MRGTIIAWLLGVGILAGCSSGAKPAAAGPRTVVVTAGAAQTKDVPAWLDAIGNVKAFATVEIRSMVRGPLQTVAFREGDEVKKGDLILLIDPRPSEAALAQAQALVTRDQVQLAKAEADLRRANELLRDRLITESDQERARADVEVLKATLASDQAAANSARLQLEYCRITAPINGRVGTLLVNAGNIVKENDSLLAVINQTRPIYVDFSVPEQVLPEVRKQMATVKLPVTVNPGSATGELAVINNAVDTTTGTVLLRAVFPNKDELLWPGQFVNVTVTLSVRRGAVVVPASAIQVGQKGPYVYVIKPDQTVESRPVVIGEELRDETVVKTGVQPGELVVTSNQLRLNPGTKVQLKRADQP